MRTAVCDLKDMKRILIFNDISGLGNCSMSANLPIFTKLGHYCMPVPTACYSCQTGFSKFSVLPNGNIGRFCSDIVSNCTPEAAYVGFCNDTAALGTVRACVRNVLPQNGYLFVDPIMGDNGKLYPVFDEGYVAEMKRVVRGADCISPNLTEACILAGVDYKSLTERKDEAAFLSVCGGAFSGFLEKVGCKNAVITGIACGKLIGNIVIDYEGVKYVTNERSFVDFSGTGDAFSSVLLGELLNGVSLLESTVIAANFVGKAAALTDRTDRRFGIDFCKVIGDLK